jgi:hypothetical protein
MILGRNHRKRVENIMSSTIISLIVSLLSGGVGARLVVGVLKQFNLGPIGNLIVGALGGAGGGSILGSLLGGGAAATAASAASSSGFDIGSIVSSLAGGGIGGAVLQVIVGLIRNMVTKR